jgi:hypothetical protein
MRNPCTWLVIALLGGVPLAGCGGSSSNSTSGTSSTATSQNGAAAGGTSASETSGGANGSGGATAGGGGPSHPLTPKQQVEACKRVVQAPSTLTAGTKAKLLKSCEQAGGGVSAQRKVIHEVCEALADRAPAGASRERALAICKRLK